MAVVAWEVQQQGWYGAGMVRCAGALARIVSGSAVEVPVR